MLRSVTDKRLFPPGIDVAATRSPSLNRGSDVGEGETSTEFGGELHGPPESLASPGAEIDCAKDTPDRKRLRSRFFYVRAGPNRALAPVEDFCRHRAEQKLIEHVAMRRHHDQVG